MVDFRGRDNPFCVCVCVCGMAWGGDKNPFYLHFYNFPYIWGQGLPNLRLGQGGPGGGTPCIPLCTCMGPRLIHVQQSRSALQFAHIVLRSIRAIAVELVASLSSSKRGPCRELGPYFCQWRMLSRWRNHIFPVQGDNNAMMEAKFFSWSSCGRGRSVVQLLDCDA
jgi:hypothetical protein